MGECEGLAGWLLVELTTIDDDEVLIVVGDVDDEEDDTFGEVKEGTRERGLRFPGGAEAIDFESRFNWKWSDSHLSRSRSLKLSGSISLQSLRRYSII